MSKPRGVPEKKAKHLSDAGVDLCRQFKYSEALPLFVQACELDPSNHVYWYNTAVACERVGDHPGMEVACRNAIECKGTFIKGYIRFAKALLHQDKLTPAAEAIATGLLIDEKNRELRELKEKVESKLDQLSMVEAKRLTDLETAEPLSPIIDNTPTRSERKPPTRAAPDKKANRRPDPDSVYSIEEIRRSKPSRKKDRHKAGRAQHTARPSPAPGTTRSSKVPHPSSIHPSSQTNLAHAHRQAALLRGGEVTYKDQCRSRTVEVTDSAIVVLNDKGHAGYSGVINIPSNIGSQNRTHTSRRARR